MKFKSRILIFSVLISLNSQAAKDLSVKFHGAYEFQFATYKSSLSKIKPLTSNQRNIGFNSLGHLNLDISNKYAQDFEYGAIIGIEITGRNDRKIPSILYFTSDAGRLEFGSNKSANSKMKITAYSLAAATAGGWDSWAVLSDNPNISFISNYGNFLDLKTRKSGKVEYSRKITYFSPIFSGWQIGISYIPDTSNVGYDTLSPENHHHEPVKPSNYYFNTKNGFAYGITYNNTFQDLGFKFAAVGENGSTIAHLKPDKLAIEPKPKFKRLFTYSLGSEISYGKYAVAFAYSNYNKSLTSIEIDQDRRDTHIYSLGGKYIYDQITASLNYFYSDHKKNRLHATTLALDYKITSGLLMYGEITNFSAKGSYIKNNKKIKNLNAGTLVLTGLKVSF